MPVGSRIWVRVLAVLAFLLAQPAQGSRILLTPFAELTPLGEHRVWGFALKEERTNGDYRFIYRLDSGLTSRLEFGTMVSDPEHGKTVTWLNFQALVAKETAHTPAVSVGLWDASSLGRLSGEKTGGSLFVAVSRSVPLGRSGPLKLNLGLGANRLEGLFGGMVLPLSKRTGLQAEYAPRNLRLPGADAFNAAVYHFVTPTLRVRASWMGGNPMLDFYAVFRTR